MEHNFKEGDTIITTKGMEFYYQAGNIGTVLAATEDSMYVSFNGQGNDYVYESGRWSVPLSHAISFKPIEEFNVWQNNYKYLTEEQQEALRELLKQAQWDKDYATEISFSDRAALDKSFCFDCTDDEIDWWDVNDAVVYGKKAERIIRAAGESSQEQSPLATQEGQTSGYFLQKAIDLQKERGKEYDAGEERSMGKCVSAFNIITGKDLTEAEGWLLLQLLKDVRQWAKSEYHADSAEDCVSYASLKAEALSKGR